MVDQKKYPTLHGILASWPPQPAPDARTRRFLIQQSQKTIKDLQERLDSGKDHDGTQLTEESRKTYQAAVDFAKERMSKLQQGFN